MCARFMPRPKTSTKGFVPAGHDPRLYKNPSYKTGLRLFRLIHDTLLNSDKPCVINKSDKFPTLTPMAPDPEDTMLDFFATDIVIPLYPRNSENLIPTTHLSIRVCSSIDSPDEEPVRIAYAYPPLCQYREDMIKPKPKKKYAPRISCSLHTGMPCDKLKKMLNIDVTP